MKLSKNFTLEELIRSDTAERLGIDNVPKDEKVIENLRNLCFEVLQQLRDYVKAPVVINSGYRCPKLNDQILLKRNKSGAVWLHVSCKRDASKNRQSFTILKN